MNKGVDPCLNFYQYACGAWNKLNPIPADQSSWGVYAKLSDDNHRFLWGMLDAAAKGGAGRSANEQKIGDYFQACMDEAAVEKAGSAPLDPTLAEIGNLKSTEEIGKYIGGEHHGGMDRGVLFGFSPGENYDNSSQMIAFISAGGLGLPDRDYYTNSDAKSQEIRQKYIGHIGRMLMLLGESATDAHTDAQTVMDIETDLAKASLTRTDKRNPYNLKHRVSRDELQRMVPSFNWDDYLAALGAPSFAFANAEEPKFFEALNGELRTRNLAAWRAYLRWHLINSMAPYLASSFAKPDFEFFDQYLEGAKEMPPRWKKCTRLVDHQLGDALGQVFVSKTFSAKTKEDASKMVQQVEVEMGRDIKDLSWMTEATKQQALEKLQAVVNKVGYPDKWKDYSSVQIKPSDFFDNVRRAATFEQQRQLGKIGKPVDRKEWSMTPPTVNAYYDPQTNDINFPAGVLQPPLFDPKMDAAPNFGNTGATIGHELTHGFDDEGRKFDAQGNLRDWWTPSDAKAFDERVACVRDQYAKYVVIDDIHINSSLTLGEDVADLGGTLLAYVAWKHATTGQDLSPVDDFTPEQRFFIGMAQWACGDQRPEAKRMRAIVDEHSPEEYRINGVVSNLPQFGEAFGCKVGQPMMRQNACRVW